WSHLTAATAWGVLNATFWPDLSVKLAPNAWSTSTIKPWPSPLLLIVTPQPHIFLLASEILSAASRRLSSVSSVLTSMPAAWNTSLRPNHPPVWLMNGTAYHLPSNWAFLAAVTGTMSPYFLTASLTTSVTSSTMSSDCICGMLRVW